MNTFRSTLVFVTLLGAAGAASAQINMPNPQAPGGSMETAVRLIASSDIMVDRQIKRWLRTHYPDWDADPHEYMQFGDERYAVVYIRSSNSPGRRVYFRVKSSMAEPDDDRGIGFP